MKNFRESAIAIGMAGALFVTGCSSPEYSAAKPPTTTAATPSSPSTEQVPTAANPKMQDKYELSQDANPALAQVQEKIGNAAVKSIMLDSVSTTINNTTYQVSMHVPENVNARYHGIFITGNSYNSGAIFNKHGVHNMSNAHGSVTDYFVKADRYGRILESGSSISIVGQQVESGGPFDAVATELCQGLEASATPPITDDNTYRIIKEADCNSLGIAADSRFLGQSYEKYVARVHGYSLPPGIAHTVEVPLPAISELQYNDLYAPSKI